MDHIKLALSLEEITEKLPNKYEFIVLASRYARVYARLLAEEGGRVPDKKPIFQGVERVLGGPVEYWRDQKRVVIEGSAGDNR